MDPAAIILIGVTVLAVIAIAARIIINRRQRPVVMPDQVDDNDMLMRIVVATAFNTGQAVVANRNDDETVDITTIPHN